VEDYEWNVAFLQIKIWPHWEKGQVKERVFFRLSVKDTMITHFKDCEKLVDIWKVL
jgi:hypothetical protein